VIPYYLKNHLTNVKEKKDSMIGTLISSTGNTDVEIYFYGDTVNIKKTPYIVDAEFPCLIVAKDPITNDEFTVFDGMKHGYDPMFCNEPYDYAKREIKLFDHYRGKVQITLGYSINYEDEKENYDFNENDEVVLMYGSLEWEKAKSIGFDWLSLKFVNTKKKFVDFELS